MFCLQMINIWDTMLKRPIIKAEITPKYDIIIDMLNNELDIVKVCCTLTARNTFIVLKGSGSAI